MFVCVTYELLRYPGSEKGVLLLEKKVAISPNLLVHFCSVEQRNKEHVYIFIPLGSSQPSLNYELCL